LISGFATATPNEEITFSFKSNFFMFFPILSPYRAAPIATILSVSIKSIIFF
jgi:hypothetical protein